MVTKLNKVFLFTFTKDLFKPWNVLHIGCLVEKNGQLRLEIVPATFLLVCYVCLKESIVKKGKCFLVNLESSFR